VLSPRGGYIYVCFARQPYDEATQLRTHKYGAKVYFFSALVVDPYEHIWAETGATARKPHGGLAWLRRAEVAAEVDPELGEYLGHLLVA
jgi:hypothetical protein